MIYNKSTLDDYCNEYSIKLLNEPTGRITRESRIIFECKQCGNNGDQCFRYFIKWSGICCVCTKENGKKKKELTNIELCGKPYFAQSDYAKNKTKKTNKEKYGCDWTFQSEDVKTKIYKTNEERYGSKTAMVSEEVKNKLKNTMIKNHGVDNPAKSKDIQCKIMQTNNEKYGCNRPTQNKEIQEKQKATCFKNHGVEWSMQSKEIQDKSKKTNLERYGFEYSHQNPEIAEKASIKSYLVKDYKFPSGRIDKVQGNEPDELDNLINIQGFKEDDIITGQKNVPTIWYIGEDDKQHRHYVDIYIPSQMLMIEVKSSWTLKKNEVKVFQKQQAAKGQGFKYEIHVYDCNKKCVEIYK